MCDDYGNAQEAVWYHDLCNNVQRLIDRYEAMGNSCGLNFVPLDRDRVLADLKKALEG